MTMLKDIDVVSDSHHQVAMVGIKQGGRSARTYVMKHMQHLNRIDSTDAIKPDLY